MHPQDTTVRRDDRVAAERVALYARVSSRRQEKEETIESQVAALEALAWENGYSIVERFIDNGYSGDTSARPELHRMRDMIAHRRAPFTKLLIYGDDRLAREIGLGILLENEIREAGIGIVYRHGNRGDDPTDLFQGHVLKAVAQLEKARMLDRLNRGLLFRVEQRQHVWRSVCNYGYRYTPAERKGDAPTFEFDPETAPYVDMIFTWILEGRSALWVAQELSRVAAPLPKPARRSVNPRRAWSDATVRDMVRNPIYSGRATWGRHQLVEPKRPKEHFRHVRKSSQRLRPRDEWKYIPVPAYVSQADWERANALLSRNRATSRRNTRHDYLLAGLLRCGLPHGGGEPCGRRLSGLAMRPEKGQTERSLRYRCTRFYTLPDGATPGHRAPAGSRRTRCRGGIRGPLADRLVWDHLKSVMNQPDLIREQILAQTARGGTGAERVEGEIATLCGRLEAVQRRLDDLLDLLLSSKIDPETYGRKEGQLVAEREAIRAAIAACERRAEAARRRDEVWDAVAAGCADLSDRLQRLEAPDAFAQRQALVRLLIQEVWVYPDHLHVVGVIPALDAALGARPAGADGGGNNGRLSGKHLSVGVYGQAAVRLGLDHADVRLDRRVLDRRGQIGVLDHLVGLGEAGLDVAEAHAAHRHALVGEGIAAPLLDDGRGGVERLQHVQHRRQLLDLQPDQRCPLQGGLLIFGQHGADRLALPHHLRVGQHRLVVGADADQA